MTLRIAAVLLVDDHGRVLLQERDEHAPVHPEQWGAPGGHAEPGESFEQAAYRELAEETEVELPPGTLTAWAADQVAESADGPALLVHTFTARTSLVDADIVCHEGRQIVFVDPADFSSLPISEVWAPILQRFVASPTYAALAGA